MSVNVRVDLTALRVWRRQTNVRVIPVETELRATIMYVLYSYLRLCDNRILNAIKTAGRIGGLLYDILHYQLRSLNDCKQLQMLTEVSLRLHLDGNF